MLSSYKFDCYFLLLLLQLVLSLAFCVVTRDLLGNPFNIPKYEEATFRAYVAAVPGCSPACARARTLTRA